MRLWQAEQAYNAMTGGLTKTVVDRGTDVNVFENYHSVA
jgi:hypothetical protein